MNQTKIKKQFLTVVFLIAISLTITSVSAVLFSNNHIVANGLSEPKLAT